MRYTLLEFVYIIPIILFTISMHEFAHGFASHKLGDPTPKLQGRITLNPFKHLDPYGTIGLILFGFGWAKPVVVNPNYYKKKKLGMVLVALAGPLINFIIAFISYFVFGLIVKFSGDNPHAIVDILNNFLYYMIMINIGLGVFNLIPVPPLDGSKILGAIIPEKQYFKYMQFERYGFMILLLLLFTGLIYGPLIFMQNGVFNIISAIVNFILQI